MEVDYSQYGSWEPMTAPTGQVYYKVPGTGYVYDPFLSQAKGRPVLWTNPEPAVNERNKAQKAAKQAASPLGQLTPVLGSVGGIVGAKYAIDALGPTSKLEAAQAALTEAQTQQVLAKTTAEQVAAQKAAQTTAQSFTQGAQAIPTPPPGLGGPTDLGVIGPSNASDLAANNPNFGSYGGPDASSAAQASDLANTMPYQEGLTVGNALSAAAVLKGGYDTYKGFEAGGEGQRAGLTTMGGGIGGLIGGPLGAGVGAVAGNVLGYGLQGNGWKNDLATLAMGGPMLLGAKKLGFLNHQTTKQAEQERWQGLKDDGIAGADAAYAANHAPGDDSIYDEGPRKGQKWNFEDAQEDAKVNPHIFRQAYGNLKTFGNDWTTKYTPEEQDRIITGLINAGQYESKKGDILIKDEDEARKIKDQVLGVTTATAPAAKTGTTQQPVVVPSTPPAQIGKQLAARINQRGR